MMVIVICFIIMRLSGEHLRCNQSEWQNVDNLKERRVPAIGLAHMGGPKTQEREVGAVLLAPDFQPGFELSLTI